MFLKKQRAKVRGKNRSSLSAHRRESVTKRRFGSWAKDIPYRIFPERPAISTALAKAIGEAAAAEGGELYALVYCAGFSMAAPIEYADEKDYHYLFDVNYFGAVRAVQCAVPFMKERGGRIVLVSSMGGLFPVAFDSFYSSSKAAVDMLVKSAALELEPYGIRVCSVQPGGTSTAFTFKRKIYGDAENGEYASSFGRRSGVRQKSAAFAAVRRLE